MFLLVEGFKLCCSVLYLLRNLELVHLNADRPRVRREDQEFWFNKLIEILFVLSKSFCEIFGELNIWEHLLYSLSKLIPTLTLELPYKLFLVIPRSTLSLNKSLTQILSKEGFKCVFCSQVSKDIYNCFMLDLAYVLLQALICCRSILFLHHLVNIESDKVCNFVRLNILVDCKFESVLLARLKLLSLFKANIEHFISQVFQLKYFFHGKDHGHFLVSFDRWKYLLTFLSYS